MIDDNSYIDLIADAIRSAVGPSGAPLHEPIFQGNEWNYVKECLDSGFVSSVGKFVDRFETELAEFTSANHAVAVVNGTAALHVALKLAGVEMGDEVLVPTLTFVATANAVSYCSATPHFVDCEPLNFGIDTSKLRDYLASSTRMSDGKCINRDTRRVIRALVPMHAFGHPVDMDEIIKIGEDFNLKIVEDAAESIGSTYKGKHTGTFGLMGVLSFNGNKTITTGGGGAILTNDFEVWKAAKHITTTSKASREFGYFHDEIGFNFRMPNINAALGCAQLESLGMLLESKRQLFLKYQEEFASIPGLRLVAEPTQCVSNYWLQTLVLDADREHNRREILIRTNEMGYGTRPVWEPIHSLPMYRHSPRMDLSCAQSVYKRLINIPSISRQLM